MKPKYILSVYFGVPGSGKTTFATFLARKDLQRNRKVWCNVPVTGTMQLDCSDLGTKMVEDGRVIIDEAGVEFDNRDFKNFPKTATYFFKYHRHYRVAVDVFSQSYDDMDKKIRSLAQRLYIVKKSMIPFFVKAVPIRRDVGVNELTKEICDSYTIMPIWSFTHKYCFAPKTWKYFNTYACKQLPIKEWKTY